MDYTTLYEAWKREKESRELQPLDKRFYIELSGYVKDLKDEIQMLDEKTLKSRLAREENDNVKKIVTDLVQSRYRKFFKAVFEGRSVSFDYLTLEEDVILNNISSTISEVKSLIRNILSGRIPRIRGIISPSEPKTILVRFLQDVPAIISPDMKAFGPFKREDVASLPPENAESLIKRGVALRVETL